MCQWVVLWVSCEPESSETLHFTSRRCAGVCPTCNELVMRSAMVVCLVVNQLLFSLNGSDLQLIFIRAHYAVFTTCRHGNESCVGLSTSMYVQVLYAE